MLDTDNACPLHSRAMTPEPAYTFSDVVTRSGATRRQVAHWTSQAVGIIRPGVRVSTGPGDPRLFSPFNLLQARVGALLSAFRIPAPTMAWVLGKHLESAYAADLRFILLTPPRPGAQPWTPPPAGRKEVTSHRVRRTGSALVEEWVVCTDTPAEHLDAHPAAIVINLARVRQALDV